MAYNKWRNICYNGIPLGLEVHKTIGGTRNNKYQRKNPPIGTCGRRETGGITYRLRTGNGKHGSIAGAEYQDKYQNNPANSIHNTQGQHARDLLKIAVANWQTFTQTQRDYWNKKVKHKTGTTGYATYVGYYISQNY